MGKRGPPPIPAKIHKLRGTFRKDRHGSGEDVVPPVVKVPRPPASLNAIGRREWTRAASQLCDVQLLTASDLNALEGYCHARSRALQAEADVEKDGQTTTTPQGIKRHPSMVTLEKAWADCRRYEGVFGMSPSARNGLDIPNKPLWTNPFADLDEEHFFGPLENPKSKRRFFA